MVVYVSIAAVAFLIGVGAFAFVAWPRPVPFTSLPEGSVCGRSLIIRFPQHPPWAYVHVINVNTREDSPVIELTEYYSVFLPASKPIRNIKPVVLEDLSVGATEIRCTGESGLVLIGVVHVKEQGDYEWEEAGTSGSQQ